jgi:hypothetical protein
VAAFTLPVLNRVFSFSDNFMFDYDDLMTCLPRAASKLSFDLNIQQRNLFLSAWHLSATREAWRLISELDYDGFADQGPRASVLRRVGEG